MKVETYTLTTREGRTIRRGTKVILDDGHQIKFIEKMSKRQAIAQATEILKRSHLHV